MEKDLFGRNSEVAKKTLIMLRMLDEDIGSKNWSRGTKGEIKKVTRKLLMI
jgi:hypothetical protein